jgi:hypothetical protein
MTLQTASDIIALWKDAIRHGEKLCSVTLQSELEEYLVSLLVHYTNKPEFAKQIIALKFLESMQAAPNQRMLGLRMVGDQCLLFSGLFPHIADRKQVKISYFVDMGRSAYAAISAKAYDLNDLLAGQFVILMDVLQSIRQFSDDIPDLTPLAAYEQWNTLGSARALRALKNYTGAIPIKIKT